MPEAPEVKLSIERIAPHLVDREIICAEIVSGKYLARHKIANWNHLLSNLPLKILEINCHGKFIYLRLSKDIAIGIGLGMVGSLGFSLNPKHNRVRLTLDNGTTLYYDDYRNFGNWVVFTSWTELDNKLSSLGIDLIADTPPNHDEMRSIYTRYGHQNICKVLMNQSLFSGPGNYLKAEALYAEKVHPMINVGHLTLEEFTRVILAARDVALMSLDFQREEGLSYRGYAGDARSKDKIKNKSEIILMVYGRKVDDAGRRVVKIATPDGRMTSYVPEVQIFPQHIIADHIIEDDTIVVDDSTAVMDDSTVVLDDDEIIIDAS